MFIESNKLGILPEQQRLATIVVLPKVGKLPQDYASYRPISLLNVKVLAKIPATRLNSVITTLIHPDQTGFMPGRSTTLNLRRIHGVLDQAPVLQEDALIFSLDARKTFDTVEWDFVVLEKVEVGPKFTK